MSTRVTALRVLWVIISLLAILLSVAGIPDRFRALQIVCSGGPCGQFGAPPTPDSSQMLHTMGFSLPFYAGYTIATEAGTALVYFLLGALLFSRARSTATLFVAGMLMAAGALATNLPDALAGAHPLWRTPVALLDAFALCSLTIFLYIFPDGRFVPRWTRLLASAAVLFYAVAFLFPGGRLQPMHNVLSLLVELALLLAGAGAQVYRYRTVSGPVQRQQTKWVVFGLAVSLVLDAAILLVAVLTPPANPLLTMAEDTLFSVGGLLMPATIAIAILHHRLYDIDTLANRTLVYGSLTISLIGLYIGSVVVLQTLFRAVAGQRSDLAIALATLIIAALFNPWRRRLQAFIDQRFYRRKYDAARILAAFNVRLRDEVDLVRLESDILTTVSETMQPERATLWLPKEARG